MSQAYRDSLQRPQPDYLRALLSTARRRPGLWVIPLFSALLGAVLFGLFGPRQWDATQTFVVREELIGRIVGPGRFDSLDSMKTAQETIQEAARRPAVLRRVLNEVGPENGEVTADWPSRETIEGLQGAISFFAPGGAELGKTELLTMKVKASSAARAKRIVSVLFEETRKEIRSLRQRKAESMIKESVGLVRLAEERLRETTAKLRELEIGVGGDLSELRRLNEPISGGGEMSRMISQLETELRAAQQQKEVAEQLIGYLEAAVDDPARLLATPRELLESQPALSQLKNRLIEAQVARSTVGGLYSSRHPRYQASQNSVVDIRKQIHQELESSLVGLKSQRELATRQIGMLQRRADEIRTRVSELASMRVDYGLLVAEMELRNHELTEAHKEFTQIESIQRAVASVDFMSKVDEAQAGIRPLGPSKKTLVLGALVAGSLIGLGFVMIVTPTPDLRPPGESTPAPRKKVDPAPAVDPFAGSSITTVAGSAAPGFVIPDIGPSTTLSDQTTV